LAAIAWVAWQFGTFVSIVIVESAMLALSWLLYYIAYRRILIPRAAADQTALETPPWPRYRKFAALCYVNEIGVSLLSVATDLFLVSAMIGGAAVGYYGLANRINDLVSRALPSRLLGPVLQPLFYSEYGSAQKEAAFGFNLLTKMTFFVTLPIGIWLAIMSEPVIVHLFDPDYAPAAPLVAVTALFLPMVTIRLPLGMMLLNAERIDLVIYSKIWAIAKIVVGIWLIPVYGVIGMVWITALSSFAQNVMIYYFIVTRMHVETDFSGIMKMMLSGGISAGLFWLIKNYFTGLIGVLTSPIVFGIVFLAISLVIKSFSPEERAFINKHLRFPVWKF
jgi:O-antigen/teichoic acid export membrane protein